ncbi:hypothetical protein CAP47_10365 [Psychroflexus sp. S27]|nr:hypothetical protein CAP47_10365 [Psychroflexus sp. S27]
MLLTIAIILGVLVLVNIFLLIFSCNSPEDDLKNKNSKKKPILPKGLSKSKSKHIVFADK